MGRVKDYYHDEILALYSQEENDYLEPSRGEFEGNLLQRLPAHNRATIRSLAPEQEDWETF